MTRDRITESDLTQRDQAYGSKITIGTIAGAAAGFGLGKLVGMAFDPETMQNITPFIGLGIGGFLSGALAATASNPVISWSELENVYGQMESIIHVNGEVRSEKDQAINALEKQTTRSNLTVDHLRTLGQTNKQLESSLEQNQTISALNYFARGRSYQDHLRETTHQTIQDNLVTLVLGSEDQRYATGLLVTTNGYTLAPARIFEGIDEEDTAVIIGKDRVLYKIDKDSVSLDKRHNLALFRAEKQDKDPRPIPIYVENRLRAEPNDEVTTYFPEAGGIVSVEGYMSNVDVDIKNKEGVRDAAITNFIPTNGLMGAPVIDSNQSLTGFVSYNGRGDDKRVAFTPIQYANNLIIREVARLSNRAVGPIIGPETS